MNVNGVVTDDKNFAVEIGRCRHQLGKPKVSLNGERVHVKFVVAGNIRKLDHLKITHKGVVEIAATAVIQSSTEKDVLS